MGKAENTMDFDGAGPDPKPRPFNGKAYKPARPGFGLALDRKKSAEGQTLSMRPWRTLARRTLLSRPPWMEVGEERVGLPDGREVDGFLWVRTRDFVAIVAVTDSDEVVLIRSYKHGPRTVSLAVPAGYIEEAEDPLGAAKRELQEETGYASCDWSSLGRYVVDGNYLVATEHIFLARAATKVAEPASGDLEEMEVVVVPLAQISEYVRQGEVVQLSSAAALAIAVLTLGSRPSPAR